MKLNETTSKFYEFINKLVHILEDELDNLKTTKSKNAISTHKKITDMLSKLLILVIQLDKLNQNNTHEQVNLESDIEIINNFLNQYKS